MKIHLVTNVLLVLITIVVTRTDSILFSKEELEPFTTDEGIWFLNDDGELVQATAELPSQLQISLFSVDGHVTFHLYTRNSTSGERIKINDVDGLKNSSFDPRRETKFVTHGWINSKKSKSCQSIKDAYLKYGDFNVIIIDWSKISMRPYIWAATHVVEVGKHVAKMIDFLEERGIDLSTTSLSGHSLGAHIVGLAGYYAKNTVNYIVGLDPALPLFALNKVGSRISIADAKQVEIIHTNAGLLGFLAPIGKADFYPNGGKRQVGCTMDLGGACSHSRSYEFFAESIVSEVGFYGMHCKDYSSYVHGTCDGELGLMGSTKSELPFSGTYYLHTSSNYPYAKGKDENSSR